MNKFTSTITVFFLSINALAAGGVSNVFTIGSGLIKDDITVTAAVTNSFSVGAGGTLINADGYKDYLYSVNLPLSLNAGFTQIVLRPFYVFEQDELDSKGAQLHFLMNIKQDDVNNVYSQAFLSAAYAHENAFVERTDGGADVQNYKQMAFSGGLRFNFYNTFFFTLGGTAHVYNSGISDVLALGSVTDKNTLANLDYYGAMFGAPKYSAGLKLARGFENKTNIYISYRFIEMYLQESLHSIIIGNEFPIYKNLWADAGYNHVIGTQSSKEDYARLALNWKF